MDMPNVTEAQKLNRTNMFGQFQRFTERVIDFNTKRATGKPITTYDQNVLREARRVLADEFGVYA